MCIRDRVYPLQVSVATQHIVDLTLVDQSRHAIGYEGGQRLLASLIEDGCYVDLLWMKALFRHRLHVICCKCTIYSAHSDYQFVTMRAKS